MITHPNVADEILSELIEVGDLSLGELSRRLHQTAENIYALILQIQSAKDKWVDANVTPTKQGPVGTIRIHPTYKGTVKMFLENGGFSELNRSLEEELANQKTISRLQFEKLESEVWELRNKPQKDKKARTLAIIAILISGIAATVQVIKALTN
jgi:hypothetical protein